MFSISYGSFLKVRKGSNIFIALKWFVGNIFQCECGDRECALFGFTLGNTIYKKTFDYYTTLFGM